MSAARRSLGLIVLLTIMGAGATAAKAISIKEIILLCRTGVSADIVIQNIRRDPNRPKLTPADVTRMKRAGVPTRVIQFLLKGRDSGQRGATSDRDRFRRDEARRRANAARRRDKTRRREAERLRQEAERLKREAKKMASAAHRARARATSLRHQVKSRLAQAFRDLRLRRLPSAITRFHAFLHSGLVQPNSYAYLEAAYGLGKSFYEFQMIQASATYFVEVVRRGPTTPRFNDATMYLGRIVGRIDYVHPVLAMLAAFERELKSRSQAWRDGYHFMLGEFYQRYDNAKKALHHFSAVSTASRRYPAARYHIGLIHTAMKRARTGVKFFRQAMQAAKRAGNRSVLGLAHLALARLAFEVGSYRAAEYFYRRIGRRAKPFARAQYELAWTLVMSEKYRQALGTIHGLHSPFFRREYQPDRLMLEAAAYWNMCRFKEAKLTLKRFNRTWGPVITGIRRYLRKNPTPDALYRDVQLLARGDRRSKLPRLAWNALLADVDLYRNFKTARLIEKERRRAATRLAGKVRKAVAADLSKRYRIYRQRVGLEIRRRLRDVLVSLDGVKVKTEEVGLEIELAEKQALERARKALQRRKQVRRRRRLSRTIRLLIKADQQVWPFEGEYWLDEIGSFRSRLRSACRPKPTRRKGATARGMKR